MGRKRKQTLPKTCNAPTCTRPAIIRGLCRRCYMRDRRRKLRDQPEVPPNEIALNCAVRGCRQLLRDEGLCVPHLLQLLERFRRRSGPLFTGLDADRCAIELCLEPAGPRGVCPRHQQGLIELAEGLPSSLGSAKPEVVMTRRQVSLEEIDLSDTRFAMRIDLGQIGALAASLTRWGMLHNVVLWQQTNGKLVPIAGQRRLQSLRLNQALGQPAAPVWALVAPPATPKETLRTIAAHENMRRDAISAYEMALLALARRRQGQDIPAIAEQLGISMESAARYLRLAEKGSAALLEALRAGQLTLAHARLVWPLPIKSQQTWVAKAIDKKMSAPTLRRALHAEGTRIRRTRVERFLANPPANITTSGPRARGPYEVSVKVRTRGELQEIVELLDRLYPE